MSADSTAVLRISTPEGVTFSLPLAGPVSRASAMLMDFIIISALQQLLQMALGILQMVSPDYAMGLALILQFVLTMGYASFCEIFFNGQSIGKRLLGLRVMDERGLGLRPSQVLVRNLLRIVDMLPFFYPVGGICCMLTQRCQRLGDLAAGTIVVRTVKATPPDVEAVLAGKYNSFRAYPHIEARLRQKVLPEEARLALAALIRKDELEPAAAVKVFAEMATRFRELVKFPDEAVYGLSDEAYVRNVVGSLYRA
jgi:uncharacterized RDD family membrane protein YckC